MKSLPVACRRRWETRSTTAWSLTSGARSHTRRSPSTSGMVSMSKTRIGVNAQASGREDAGGEVAVAAIADDVDDHRVLHLGGKPERRGEPAARRDARED